MKVVFHLSYVIGLVFIIGETLKRGIGYFAINATTMFEDYVGGAVLILAAVVWAKGYKVAPKMMAAAWGYTAGGLMVPFFAHLEAWLRGTEFRPDHDIQDVKSIVIKGVLWAISLACLYVSLRSDETAKPAVQSSHSGGAPQ